MSLIDIVKGITADQALVVVGIFSGLATVAVLLFQERARVANARQKLRLLYNEASANIEQTKLVLNISFQTIQAGALARGAMGGYVKHWENVVVVDKNELNTIACDINTIKNNVSSWHSLLEEEVNISNLNNRISRILTKHEQALRNEQENSRIHNAEFHAELRVQKLASLIVHPLGSDYREIKPHPFARA